MKSKLLGLVLGAVSSAGFAAAPSSEDLRLNNLFLTIVRADLAQNIQNLINWRVGEFHTLKIDFLGSGDGRKEVTKEEPSEGALWYVTTMNIMGQKQVSEALIRRADGKLLKLIVNGEEQDPNQGGDGEMEIIEQKETSVTVPAGTFECMYVKVKTTAQGQSTELELWANPIDVNLDGMLKLSMQTQFGIPLVISLVKFGSR